MIATGQSQQILGLENAFGTRDRVNFHMEREIQRLLLPGLSVGAKSLWHSVRISFFWFVRAISQPVTSCLPTSREQSAGRPWGERRRESMHGLFSPNDSADIRVSGGRLPQPGQTKGDPPRPPSTRASHSRASSVTTNCLLRQRLPSNALRNQRHSYGLSNVLEVPNWRKIAFA